jgi:hypothetical protein
MDDATDRRVDMGEMSQSVASKLGWWQVFVAGLPAWTRVPGMRIVAILAFVALLGLAIEAGAAYVIYRHYSAAHGAFYPTGSAALSLGRLMTHSGRRDEVTLSIDHGPLFHADPKLGYTLYPGRYRIVEARGGRKHQFTLTVDENRHRVTSASPNVAARRIFVAGDSAMFGWGLNDEQTAPWLLQARFPAWQVSNLSLTSYSTLQALFELEAVQPAVRADDIVVLTYHPVTNSFNTAAAEMLTYLRNGFEQQLGDAGVAQHLSVPFGTLVDGELKVRSYPIACGSKSDTDPRCARVVASSAEAIEVSKKAFDAIMDAHPAHYVVIFLSGQTSDPVIAHLRARGALIADVRTDPGDADANDELTIDEHAGPFWHHMFYERLTDALLQSRLVD